MKTSQSLLILLALLLLSSLCLHFAAERLGPGIRQQADLQRQQQLLGFLPESLRLHTQLVTLAAPSNGWPLPISSNAEVYQLQRHGQLYALLVPITTQGFRGPIHLRLAISPTGQLLASDVIAQRETPGLGANISADNHAWLQQFNGAEQHDSWQLRSDGGHIDQISGATITSRAASRALQQALTLVAKHPHWLQVQP